MKVIKRFVKYILHKRGYVLVPRAMPPPPVASGARIPDHELYAPLFSPWLGGGSFRRYADLATSKTLVSLDRCWVLYCLLLQSLKLGGEVWECGVYRGGTARMLAQLIADNGRSGTVLRLFDTFSGMPPTDVNRDMHRQGDFADTSVDAVKEYVGHRDFVTLHPGWVPETFGSLAESEICFAHIDVDIYQSVIDSCQFILPRLQVGGVAVFDDYGFPTCPGARAAVDDFFRPTPYVPLVLPTGQAVVFKFCE